MSKERLTVTVDPHLVNAGNEEVAAGRVESLSAWVNQALAERAARDRRRRALAGAVAAYEEQFGEITAEEMAAQVRADRLAARVIRHEPPRAARSRRRSRA